MSNEPTNKVIIDANLDRLNVLKFEDFVKVAIPTLDEIDQIILPLCGPNATQDLIIFEHVNREFMSNVFTSDGINILKNVEHMSPIQTFLMNYVRYIAERVDWASGDGTSTAIHLSSVILRHALIAMTKMTNDIKKAHKTKYELIKVRSEVAKEFRTFLVDTFNLILDELDKLKIDLRELPIKLRQQLIYQLAYTTSKGYKQLSNYAVEIFTDLPEILYEHTQFKRSEVETDDELSIDYPDYQAMIPVMPSQTTSYNLNLSTELLYEECDLLICPEYLHDTTLLLQFIERRKAFMTTNMTTSVTPIMPLLIIVNGIDDRGIIALERAIDTNYMTLCRRIAYHPVFLNNPTELFAIMSMADAPYEYPFKVRESVEDYENSLIRGVKCHIAGKDLKISNLFTVNESKKMLHPKYVSEKDSGYNQLRMELETRIDAINNSHSKKSMIQELNEFTRIYKTMVCSQLPTLTVGGSTINHLANIDVIKDVVAVVSVAMKHGVILDLIPKLANIIAVIPKNLVIHHNKKVIQFLLGVHNDITDYGKMTYGRDVDVLPPLKLLDPDKHRSLKYFTFIVGDGSTKWESLESMFTSDSESTPTINVVQSYRSIKETISRLMETVPKLVTTDRIIVPNGVMSTKDESNSE